MKTYTWKEAFEDSNAAAKAGNPRAQNFTGYCYDQGRCVKKDSQKALFWYTKAAENGNVHGMFNLALAHDSGRYGNAILFGLSNFMKRRRYVRI
jgi:TPR repeat protein